MNEEYFNWLCELVCGDGYSEHLLRRELLRHLHQTEFTYILPMDGNRFEDGINLRYRFGDEIGYDARIITSYIDDRPCSVLEMMVALAARCEEQIMNDPTIGDRTGVWFWSMVGNMGLDDDLDEDEINDILERFLNREYEPNGQGGLFTLEGWNRDLRRVEIWYQAMWYLDDILQSAR